MFELRGIQTRRQKTAVQTKLSLQKIHQTPRVQKMTFWNWLQHHRSSPIGSQTRWIEFFDKIKWNSKKNRRCGARGWIRHHRRKQQAATSVSDDIQGESNRYIFSELMFWPLAIKMEGKKRALQDYWSIQQNPLNQSDGYLSETCINQLPWHNKLLGGNIRKKYNIYLFFNQRNLA